MITSGLYERWNELQDFPNKPIEHDGWTDPKSTLMWICSNLHDVNGICHIYKRAVQKVGLWEPKGWNNGTI